MTLTFIVIKIYIHSNYFFLLLFLYLFLILMSASPSLSIFDNKYFYVFFSWNINRFIDFCLDSTTLFNLFFSWHIPHCFTSFDIQLKTSITQSFIVQNSHGLDAYELWMQNLTRSFFDAVAMLIANSVDSLW